MTSHQVNQQTQFKNRLFKDRKKIFENYINNKNIFYYIYTLLKRF
jgi:hypothetical protein